MKNIRTPRTLAGCTFETGYAEARPKTPSADKALLVVAAVVVLVLLAIWKGWM